MSIRDKLYHYEADVLSVKDGDTIVVKLLGGFFWWENPKATIRLYGINCHETKLIFGTTQLEKEAGLLAKSYVENLLLGKRVVIHSKSAKLDAFGRILAVVYVDELNLNEDLLEKGYAHISD